MNYYYNYYWLKIKILKYSWMPGLWTPSSVGGVQQAVYQ